METQFNLLNVSHVSPEKGVSDYIEIATKLKSLAKVNVFWMGNGRLFNKVKDNGYVKFIGSKKGKEKEDFFNLPNLIQVSTSYFEGFCIPIAEAALKEIPTISYNIPEIVSVYGNYHNTSEYRNVNKLFLNILHIISNYEHFKKRASKLKNHIIENYSNFAINQKLRKIWEVQI